MSKAAFEKIAAGLVEAATMTVAWNAYWSKVSALGDPIRRPHLMEEIFAAGFVAGQRFKGVDAEPTP